MKTTKRLFVGNLSYSTKNFDLKEHFERVGNVVDVIVMEDSFGRSKGFGYVEFDSENSAISALNTLDGSELMGRRIRIDTATQRRDRVPLKRDRSRSRERYDDRGYHDLGRHNDSYDDRYNSRYNERYNDRYNERYNDMYNHSTRESDRDWDIKQSCDKYSTYDRDRQEMRLYESQRQKFYDSRFDNNYNSGSYYDRYSNHSNNAFELKRNNTTPDRVEFDLKKEDLITDKYSTNSNDGVCKEELSQTVVFVRNLPYHLTSGDLKNLFIRFNVVEANVATDRMSKKSKGFGFVIFQDEKSQQQAIQEGNEIVVDGRRIMVRPASKNQEEKTKQFIKENGTCEY
ncbi:Ribonucleoprotein [Entamoeba marina]